ncbi:hypothetical protein [Nostoc sp. FACHB-110]|uniref:hypothetical protein n=1 Tax=Nostoc sp. FACHB-110 TaxID=2692834 RepID=UPI0016829216|nr:hypothetical protein [Nostoc sp. FACHB-110]MBD2438421.1 hypothetical protein [Nostoc sp. FACHB-110]
MLEPKFANTLAAIELNVARKLNWDYQQFKTCLNFTVNKEAIEIESNTKTLTESEVQTLKKALLDYGFQYKKTVDDCILVFEQDVELR